MTLSRERLLHEMGLGPIWRLRGAEDGDEISPPAGEAGERPPASAPGEAERATATARAQSSQSSQLPRPPLAADDVAMLDWPALRESIAACSACDLCRDRRQAVPGVGDEKADWLFVGEGPGAEEDARGEPFVGQAGKLLDAMLAAIDLGRGDNVYIANAVKCRPPANRTPEAGEIAACRPWLRRQIALLRPKLIVLLGRAAVHAVLGEERSLGGSRGKRFEYRDGELVVPVVVTYHPAYLLRNLPDKAKAWEDLCFARRLMREAQAAGRDLPLEGNR